MPTAAHTPAARVLALQRSAGNRSTGAMLRARRMLQRSIEDDLRAAPPAERIPEGKVDLPANTGKWKEGEQYWRIPLRVYPLEDVPRELDGLTMQRGTRATPNSPEKDLGPVTLADIRREAALKGDRRTVAIGLHAGQLRLVGYDVFEIRANDPMMPFGFVFSDPRSGRVGEALLVARVRAAINAGLYAMRLSVASPEVKPFHDRIADAAGAPRPQTAGWALDLQQMANLLASWDLELTPEQRAALRKGAATPKAKLAETTAVLAKPAPPKPERPPPGSVRPESVAIDPQAARSQAVGHGAVLIAEWLRGLAKWFADKREDEQAQQQANAVSADIATHQAAKPTDGALVRMVFHRQVLPNEPGSGQARFAYFEHGFGASESEARVALNQQQVARPKLGNNESDEFREKWIPPVTPIATSGLRPPFPRIAAGGIRGTKLKFQDVKFDAGGFDDEAVTEVAFAREEDARFLILRVPEKLQGLKIPVEPRAPREGPAVPSVDLDPGTPFADVHAVAVFPENETTRMAFERAPATMVGAWAPPFPNFELLRWVRPEDLRVLQP